jgi:hypothetical protein
MEKKEETVKEFMKRIGTRKLTDAEARYLYLLSLKEGEPTNTGFAEILANREPGQRLADVKTSKNWPCPDEPE